MYSTSPQTSHKDQQQNLGAEEPILAQRNNSRQAETEFDFALSSESIASSALIEESDSSAVFPSSFNPDTSSSSGLDIRSPSLTVTTLASDSSDSDDYSSTTTETSTLGPSIPEDSSTSSLFSWSLPYSPLLQVYGNSNNNNNSNRQVSQEYLQQRQEEEQRIHRHPILVRLAVHTVLGLLTIAMNAAITIFGMGIGVGLILGESFRSNENAQNSHNHRNATNSNSEYNGRNSITSTTGENTPINQNGNITASSESASSFTGTIVVTHRVEAHSSNSSSSSSSSSSTSSSASSTTPSCRLVHREIRVQPPPSLSSLAAATMPAQ